MTQDSSSQGPAAAAAAAPWNTLAPFKPSLLSSLSAAPPSTQSPDSHREQQAGNSRDG